MLYVENFKSLFESYKLDTPLTGKNGNGCLTICLVNPSYRVRKYSECSGNFITNSEYVDQGVEFIGRN